MTAINTLHAAEVLQKAGIAAKQAKAMVEALTPASQDLVTKDFLAAELSKMRAQLIAWMVGLHVATVSIVVALITR